MAEMISRGDWEMRNMPMGSSRYDREIITLAMVLSNSEVNCKC